MAKRIVLNDPVLPGLPSSNQSDISGTALKVFLALGAVFLFGRALLKKSNEDKKIVTTTKVSEPNPKPNPKPKPKPTVDEWGRTPIDRRPVGHALFDRNK